LDRFSLSGLVLPKIGIVSFRSSLAKVALVGISPDSAVESTINHCVVNIDGRVEARPTEAAKARVAKRDRLRLSIVPMSQLEEIKQQVMQLTVREQRALRNWLYDILEDELELTDEFKAKIERAKRDIAEGRGRIAKR
jgi:hypothetical protein